MDEWLARNRLGASDQAIRTLKSRFETPSIFAGSVAGLEWHLLLELETLLEHDVDGAGERARMFVRRDPLDYRKRSHEGVVAPVEASRRPFESWPEVHGAMGPDFAVSLLCLVVLDDEAAQGIMDGHRNYKSDEWLDSESQ